MNKNIYKQLFFTASSSQLSAGSTGIVVYSNPQKIERIDSIGLEFIWTAGTSGIISIDASVDYSAPPVLASSSTLGPSPFTASSSYHFFPWLSSSSLNYSNGVPTTNSSGLAWVSFQQSPWPWMQVRFTASAATTGTIYGWIVGKDI